MTPPTHASRPAAAPPRGSRLRRAAAIGLATGLAATGIALGTGITAGAAPQGSLPTGTQLYKDPNSQVARWVAANPGDSRQPVISRRIASQPQAIWFSSYSPSTITDDVKAVTTPAAAAGQVPVLAVYEIPDRDCGGASAGGAPDLASYDAWVRDFAAGLGSGRSIIILEPDSVSLTTCLTAQEQSDRFASLSRAGAAIHSADPNAKVYMDGGHSAWNSATEQANRLRDAGILANADGLFTNVSNFNTTANEVNFAKNVLAALGNPSGLHAVVDTSRNGNGPAPGGAWCDPSGRAIGTYPTTDTGDAAIDAFLWVKPPGEADGCAGAAGTFLPDVAYALASAGTSDPTTPPTTAPPTTTPPPTTPPSGGTCAVTYTIANAWTGGFTADVTVRNTGSATVNGWSLRWTFPGDQKITSAWNARTTQSGAAVTATDLGYNATVPVGGSVDFGFQGTTSSTAPPSSFTLNGAACSSS
ncbi:endoglucanase [Actinacidiphila yanglinensis]|uniref:Glucanase n=1 Tax=Actinacidiphila yanglinensis TaxID=310779 RepID=A0A1H6DIW4_9ACTN|nr:glycoside hydrolase family 6 protein [Actinacidiphila yanglinensis]SEG84793.1 endoglucanase [Actinacidiphila yanglinensis]